MRLRPLGVLGFVFASAPAFAASDLTTAITTTSGNAVYTSAAYTVKVSNGGNAWAYGSTVTIQLPETNTSPTVYVMGTVGTMTTGCAQSGTVVTCPLGSIKKGTFKQVVINLNLPQSADPIVIDAHAATTSTENSTTNNDASHTAALTNNAISFTGDLDVSNSHCTGTALASYYECTLFPSSIASFDSTLNADNTITIVGVGPEYTGSWSQPSSTRLQFDISEYGIVVAEFDGYGVPGSCWEGLTTFPGSSYVSPYKVCPR